MRIEWIETRLKEAEGMIYDNMVNEGIAVMNSLLYDEPGYGSLHNYIGWAYLYYTSETMKAEQHLTYAIKFAAQYPAPYQHLGTLYIRLGRYDEAIAILEKGLTIAGANKLALYEAIGQAYELKRDYAKAIRAYKEGMLSTVNTETAQLAEGIKRCRKKRWVMLLSF